MTIDVIHLGMDTAHGEEFVYARPRGTGAWVFMHLPVPLDIDTAAGRMTSTAGDCILHDARFPQMHRSLRGGFGNDWMHFRGAGVGRLVKECALPVNRLLRLRSADFVRVAMVELGREMEQRGLHWERRVSLLTVDLLLQLSRRTAPGKGLMLSRAESEHQAKMNAVRGRMLARVSHAWTIAEAAKMAGLSEPRFSALYRRFFGTSPNDDLIRARVEHAKALLAQTSLPIGAVAERSGFESVYYFSRLFRQRVGCAPRDYLR